MSEITQMPNVQIEKRRFPIGTVILIALAGVGLVVGIIRFVLGMGATTNLSDFYPWGIWIGFDVISGVALGSGAFTLAAIVHIFHLEKYRPVLRPAILTGFIGYILVIMGLLVDLGRPYNIWHLIIYWNSHSPLFEVGWCVMIYTSVLGLEVLPLVFERFNKPKALRVIHSLTIPLIIAGITLSTMHQSTLGTLFLAMPDKLHPLWYSPLLPVFFYISAIALGLAMVILESTISAKVFKHGLEKDVLSGLGRAIPYVLGLYLLLKLGDLVIAGEFGLMFEGSLRSFVFLAEIAVVILCIVLFALPKFRRDPAMLFWSSVITIMGTVFNRINVSLIGPRAPAGALYLPNWMEVAVTVGLVSGGLIIFMLAVRFLPVFEEAEGHAD